MYVSSNMGDVVITTSRSSLLMFYISSEYKVWVRVMGKLNANWVTIK